MMGSSRTVTAELKMKDVPMLDSDRELLRSEFEGFDDMTLEQFRQAKDEKIDSLLDFMNKLRPPDDC